MIEYTWINQTWSVKRHVRGDQESCWAIWNRFLTVLVLGKVCKFPSRDEFMLLYQNSVIDVSVDFRQPCLRGMHQHGVTFQSSVNLGKTFLRIIYRIWKFAQTWILEREFTLPSLGREGGWGMNFFWNYVLLLSLI